MNTQEKAMYQLLISDVFCESVSILYNVCKRMCLNELIMELEQ